MEKDISKKPIQPQEAVKAAADYFSQVVMPIDANTRLVLEELETSTDGKNWLVTLSHMDPTAPALFTLYPGSDKKLYKVFIVDAFTAQVKSMKAKKIE
jgi:hypothetical protein